MKKFYDRFLITILLLIVFSLTFVGCISQNLTFDQKLQDLSKRLNKESVVEKASITQEEDYIGIAVIIKNDANTEEAKKKMESYANQINSLSSDRLINLQAVQNGKNITNIVFEPKTASPQP